MRFIYVDGHQEAQISAQFCLIRRNFSHFEIDWSVVGHFLPFLSLHLTRPGILTYDFREGV